MLECFSIMSNIYPMVTRGFYALAHILPLLEQPYVDHLTSTMHLLGLSSRCTLVHSCIYTFASYMYGMFALLGWHLRFFNKPICIIQKTMPSVQPAIHMICRLLHGTCIGKMLILFSNIWSPFHMSPISLEKNGSICCAYNLIQNLTSVCGFQHNTSLLNYVLVPADYGYPNKISCILILTEPWKCVHTWQQIYLYLRFVMLCVNMKCTPIVSYKLL